MRNQISIYLTVILFVLPRHAFAIDNVNKSDIKNDLQIEINSGNSNSESIVEFEAKAVVNGETLINENVKKRSPGGFQMSYFSELKKNNNEEPKIERELKIIPDDELKQAETRQIQVMDQQRRETEIKQGQVKKETIERHNTLLNEQAEFEEEKELKPDETITEQYYKEDNIDLEAGICSEGNCQETEESQGIISLVINYFVNIFSKLIKVFE